MSQYYVPAKYEQYVRWRIPFTSYYLYKDPDLKVWKIVEKELSNTVNIIFCDSKEENRIYSYRFL